MEASTGVGDGLETIVPEPTSDFTSGPVGPADPGVTCVEGCVDDGAAAALAEVALVGGGREVVAGAAAEQLEDDATAIDR